MKMSLIYTVLPRDVRGRVVYRIGSSFSHGSFDEKKKLDRFRSCTLEKLAIEVIKPLFNDIINCSNTVSGASFTMRDMFAYVCVFMLIGTNSYASNWCL